MESLLKVLINREGKDTAYEIVSEMIDRMLIDNEDPEEILYDYGFEPDYVVDLISYASPRII